MIHIEKGQIVPENENLIISSATGDYADNDLMEFCSVEDRSVILGTFQAQFILYGNIVYKFNDPKELGEEILKIDPESTHTAASYVRITKDLLSQMEGGSLEPDSLTQALSDEQTNMENKISDTVPEEQSTAPSENETPIETVKTITETDENGNTKTTTTTTTTTTTENTSSSDVPVTNTNNQDLNSIPEKSVTDAPIIDSETPTLSPEKTSAIVPDVPVLEDVVTPFSVDKPVSTIKGNKKIV